MPSKSRVVVTIVFFAMIFAAIGVLSIGLYRARTSTEPVWSDHARTWSRVPLTVTWTAVGEDTYDTSFRGAIDFWNREVGCKLFVEIKEPVAADVTISPYMGSPCGRSSGKTVEHEGIAATWYCTDKTADVEFKVLSDLVSTYRATIHEFGHVLGLAHQKRGLMAPSFKDPTVNGGQLQLAPIVDVPVQTRDALRARYCPDIRGFKFGHDRKE